MTKGKDQEPVAADAALTDGSPSRSGNAVVRWWRETREAKADLGDEWRWWHAVPYSYYLTPEWWRYILGKRSREVGVVSAAVCRWRGHPCGVWWMNPGGFEPDMHCKNCGDDLG